VVHPRGAPAILGEPQLVRSVIGSGVCARVWVGRWVEL
jgi:hypothetical protein